MPMFDCYFPEGKSLETGQTIQLDDGSTAVVHTMPEKVQGENQII